MRRWGAGLRQICVRELVFIFTAEQSRSRFCLRGNVKLGDSSRYFMCDSLARLQAQGGRQRCSSWCRRETWSGPSDLSLSCFYGITHAPFIRWLLHTQQRASERVGEIYLFIPKEWRGGFMSYQSSCIFSAWWIMVRYLLTLWREEWRQPLTSFLSHRGYTRQPSPFTAPLADATDADEVWQSEVFVLNPPQKHTGWSGSPAGVSHTSTFAWSVECLTTPPPRGGV